MALFVVIKCTKMVGGMKLMKKGETHKKNCPRKAQGNHRLEDIGIIGMMIIQGMLK